MSDNRNYSVITNFGCHWQCPYCIVRNTGIQIAETRMGATYDTVMDLADSGKMKFLSFSGGGDPLWGLDIRRAYWYASITRSLYEYDIETEMHTSMPSMVKRMYNLAPAVEFSRIKASQTEKYHESRKVRTTLTVYRLQCSRGHISTSWFIHAALASRQWKELVDEYKGKDTK